MNEILLKDTFSACSLTRCKDIGLGLYSEQERFAERRHRPVGSRGQGGSCPQLFTGNVFRAFYTVDFIPPYEWFLCINATPQPHQVDYGPETRVVANDLHNLP